MTKDRAIRVKIRGKWWRIKKQKAIKLEGTEVRGFCDINDRIIAYSDGPDAALTLIHETLHACLWDLDEKAVEETEEAIKEVLIKTKFFKEPQ